MRGDFGKQLKEEKDLFFCDYKLGHRFHFFLKLFWKKRKKTCLRVKQVEIRELRKEIFKFTEVITLHCFF